jgi:hypothetical protein
LSKQLLSFNVEQFFNAFSSHFLVVQFDAVLLDFMIAMAFILSRHLDNFYTHTGELEE